jgi:glycerol-3-phosphate O-acyltransferase
VTGDGQNPQDGQEAQEQTRRRMSKNQSDDITQAVLGRDEVAALLLGAHGLSAPEAREQVLAYIGELRTTQRLPLYRAIRHPLFFLLRHIQRIAEHAEIPVLATRAGHVLYVSNHKSHTDYLVQPLVLDAAGVRPPVIAAGINLFGGPLGLLHRHVTGAIPIRRNTKDPVYLVTLKAYIAEILRRHDLLFYFEGGRSYNGELKAPKTGLFHASLQAGIDNLSVVPMAIAYDVVLEERALARQGEKRHQRSVRSELMEMLSPAVGYETRAFVTFGDPIPLAAYDPSSKRDVLDLAHETRRVIGRLHKVVPTAVVATAMRPNISRGDLESRIASTIDQLQRAGANLAATDTREVVDDGVRRLEKRGVLVAGRGRVRVRERSVLRYYARTIAHLLPPPEDGD